MKGLLPLVLGIFGTFAFSWAGLTVIPNAQIGHLDPQMDEEGNDPYPAPKSGMADRGRKVYVGNGCVYCHSQQVRPDYAASDLDRKWGERRSAPRDYIFERPALIGKMRMGPDLANIGKRAPSDDENAPAPGSTTSTTTAPAAVIDTAGSTPPAPAPAAAANSAGTPAASNPPAVAAVSPAPPAAAAQAAPTSAPGTPSPPATATGEPPAASPPGSGGNAPATASAEPPAPSGSPAAPPAPAGGGASPAPATAAQTASGAVAPTTDTVGGAAGNEPLPYSAAWHHRHLYQPRSITPDSNMPSYRFLYEKRRIAGQPAADVLKFSEPGIIEEGWEIVPSYEAKCLVAYLMSLDQSHPLNEVKSTTPASPPAPGKAVK